MERFKILSVSWHLGDTIIIQRFVVVCNRKYFPIFSFRLNCWNFYFKKVCLTWQTFLTSSQTFTINTSESTECQTFNILRGWSHQQAQRLSWKLFSCLTVSMVGRWLKQARLLCCGLFCTSWAEIPQGSNTVVHACHHDVTDPLSCWWYHFDSLFQEGFNLIILLGRAAAVSTNFTLIVLMVKICGSAAIKEPNVQSLIVWTCNDTDDVLLLFPQLILGSVLNFPLLETTLPPLPPLFKEEISFVSGAHWTSWEQWVSFVDKPTGKQQPMWRNKIALPTFPGALSTNCCFFPDKWFAFFHFIQ